jgi:hypothetical protein
MSELWAVSTETVNAAFNEIERIGSWPIQALNVGLFVLVLGVCWLFLRSTRGDLLKLQKTHEDERKEYVTSLKVLLTENGKIIERNNTIFERIDRRLERMNNGGKG